MEGSEFAIFGLGGMFVTALIVQVLKAVWLNADGEPVIQDRWAVVASIVVGLILSAAAYVGSVFPEIQTALQVIGAGLLAGLAACGIYSGTKARG